MSSPLFDTKTSFGWISITLHWLTAIFVIALWFLGDSISTQQGEAAVSRRNLHMSIGALTWLFLWFRIGWRLTRAHPRVHGQTRAIHQIAQSVHYLLLLCIGLMLVSGPLMVWTRGFEITVLNWFSIPSPFEASPDTAATAYKVHAFLGKTLLILSLVHIGGALKHLMFNDDETIARMFSPSKPSKKDRGKDL